MSHQKSMFTERQHFIIYKMTSKDTQPGNEVGRVLERLADPLARFIDDALQSAIGHDPSGVVNRLLELDDGPGRSRIRTISDLDLSGLLRLLDQCLFIPRPDQDRHGDREWKLAFRSLFGVPREADWHHANAKKVQVLISSVRTVRNENAHRSAGAIVSASQSLSDLSKLHDFVTANLTPIARANIHIFKNETRIALDKISEQVDLSMASASRASWRKRSIWPFVLAVAIAVLGVSLFLPDLLQQEQVKRSEVLLLSYQYPNGAVLDSLATYLRSRLDSGSVVIRLITVDGLRPSVVSIANPGDISTHELTDLFVGMKELRTARQSSDLVASAFGRMQAAQSSGASIMLVTLGSAGKNIDSSFEEDYRSERWHYTPNDFSATWRSLREKGRFYDPVFIYPNSPSWIDLNSADSYQIEGLVPTVIEVKSWY